MQNAGLSKLWNSIRFSYWFVPSLIALGGIGLAFIALWIDETESIEAEALSWFYQGGPDGARALLSTVAGSMVTVAATAFSITIVALQLAATNFVDPVTFERLVNLAFNQIRHYGKSDVVVMIRLMDAIAEIALQTHRAHDRSVLQKQADTILRSSRSGLSEEYDQNLVEEHYSYAARCLAKAELSLENTSQNW